MQNENIKPETGQKGGSFTEEEIIMEGGSPARSASYSKTIIGDIAEDGPTGVHTELSSTKMGMDIITGGGMPGSRPFDTVEIIDEEAEERLFHEDIQIHIEDERVGE